MNPRALLPVLVLTSPAALAAASAASAPPPSRLLA
jgi:hypothetical protein